MRLPLVALMLACLLAGCAATPNPSALARLGAPINLTPEQQRAVRIGMTRFHRGPEALRLGDVRAVRTDGGAIQVCGYAYTGGQSRTEFLGRFASEQSRDVALEVPTSDEQRRDIVATCAAKGLRL
jgi:hypothetical protein